MRRFRQENTLKACLFRKFLENLEKNYCISEIKVVYIKSEKKKPCIRFLFVKVSDMGLSFSGILYTAALHYILGKESDL